MFIEPAGANCACELLLWSLIPTQARTQFTVPKLGEVLGAECIKSQSFCLVSSMFIEPVGFNCACGLLLWSLIPTQDGPVPNLGGILGAE